MPPIRICGEENQEKRNTAYGDNRGFEQYGCIEMRVNQITG